MWDPSERIAVSEDRSDAPAPVVHLVERLHEEVGEGLRAVVYGDFLAREYTTLVAADRTEERLRRICDDIALEELATERQTDLSGPVGKLEVTSRVFEDGAALVAWGRERPSVYVELDGEGEIAPVADLLRSYLDR